MLPGDITEGIPEWRAEVTVNGITRATRGISWDTVISSDLPDQVVASGGLSGTTGTIAWASQDPVSARPVSPWAKVADWPPSAGDVVQIRVTDGVTWWTRWTGVIDNTTGTPTSGYSSKIIDQRDRITGLYTHQALLRHMPPFTEDGAYRSIGLSHWFLLTQALRKVGFCNVPPVEGPSAMSAPLQGSVWPEAGSLRDATGVGGIHAGFFRTDYGYAAGGFTATYVPRLSESSSTSVQLTVVVPGTHSGVTTMDVLYGQRTIRLRVNASRGVTAFFSPTSTSPWTTVTQVGGSSAEVTTVVQLLVKDSSWQLRTSNGATATGSQDLGTGTMSLVVVAADEDSRVAGLQVSHPTASREFASIGFTPSMRFTPSGLASTMDMMPAVKGRSISNLVDEILQATLTASWWDESGALILRPSDLLRGTAPSQTVTTADDVTALSWEDSLLSVRSTVEVAWKDPSISKGRQYRLELWRGSADTLLSDSDPLEEFVTPESSSEWFGVDRSLRRLTDSNWGAYNERRGSYCGVWLSNSQGDPVSGPASVRISSDNLYADSLKITTTVLSMSSALEVNTATHPEATALKAYLRGEALPVVRGMGRGEWVDATYEASAGPESAPLLVHELRYWGGEYFAGGSVAQRIGDFLASMVSSPQPVITDLGLIYDPRRQLGDVVTLRSEWIGVELRLLITGISEDHSEGAQQTVTARVISAESIRPVTYAELEAAWASGDYNALESVWSLLDYDAFTADPLEGAPE